MLHYRSIRYYVKRIKGKTIPSTNEHKLRTFIEKLFPVLRLQEIPQFRNLEL